MDTPDSSQEALPPSSWGTVSRDSLGAVLWASPARGSQLGPLPKSSGSGLSLDDTHQPPLMSGRGQGPGWRRRPRAPLPSRQLETSLGHSTTAIPALARIPFFTPLLALLAAPAYLLLLHSLFLVCFLSISLPSPVSLFGHLPCSLWLPRGMGPYPAFRWPLWGSQGSQHCLPGAGTPGPQATHPAVLSTHRTRGLGAQKPLVRSCPGSVTPGPCLLFAVQAQVWTQAG